MIPSSSNLSNNGLSCKQYHETIKNVKDIIKSLQEPHFSIIFVFLIVINAWSKKWLYPKRKLVPHDEAFVGPDNTTNSIGTIPPNALVAEPVPFLIAFAPPVAFTKARVILSSTKKLPTIKKPQPNGSQKENWNLWQIIVPKFFPRGCFSPQKL